MNRQVSTLGRDLPIGTNNHATVSEAPGRGVPELPQALAATGTLGNDTVFRTSSDDRIEAREGSTGSCAFILAPGAGVFNGGNFVGEFDVHFVSGEFGTRAITVERRSSETRDTGFGRDAISNAEGALGGAVNDKPNGSDCDTLFPGCGGHDLFTRSQRRSRRRRRDPG